MTATVPSVAQQIDDTGLHPIADGRAGRGRHCTPWTASSVWADAVVSLWDVPGTGRRVDRDFIGGAMPLRRDERAAATWTRDVLTRALSADPPDWRSPEAYQ